MSTGALTCWSAYKVPLTATPLPFYIHELSSLFQMPYAGLPCFCSCSKTTTSFIHVCLFLLSCYYQKHLLLALIKPGTKRSMSSIVIPSRRRGSSKNTRCPVI